MTTDILDVWPFEYKPRQNQEIAFEWLTNQNAKFLLLEAPTGSGKSNLAITYSHLLTQKSDGSRGDSFILTPQRVLQNQYETSFRDIQKVNLASLHGKANYSCVSKGATCEIGSIVKPKCNNCPFAAAKRRAQKANDTVLNYKLALTSFAHTDNFEKRKLMILDECHTLENHLVDFDVVSITEWRCDKHNIVFRRFRDMEPALKWMTDTYRPGIRDAADILESRCESILMKDGSDLTRSDISKLRELQALQSHVDDVTELVLRPRDSIKNDFVLVWTDKMFEFKRITGAYSFHKHILPMADRFLFMSSTILNREGFCKDLGISKEDSAFISLNSDFPKENRSIFLMPRMRMNAKWKSPELEKDRQEMLGTVKTLLTMHKKETGIIHTGNFQIAAWLIENLTKDVPHDVFQHNPDIGSDRNTAISEFQQSEHPSVLISPSSTEGLDLKDDLGRFAIFVKVGFPSLLDQWIKRRMELSNEWYLRQTLISVIQGSGRIIRSKEDWGNVYILDGSFLYLRNQTYYMMPRWWKEAIQHV